MSQPRRSRSTSRRRNPGPGLLPTPVARPVVRPSRSRSRSRSRTSLSVRKQLNSPVLDFVNAISAPLSDPKISTAFAISTLLVGVGIFLHINSPQSSWVNSFSTSLKNSTSLKPLGTFIEENTARFLGALIFVPVVFSAPSIIRMDTQIVRTPSKFLLFALTTLYCMWMKEFHLYDYWVQAVGLLLLLHLKSNSHRLLVLGVVLFLWFVSYETSPSIAQPQAVPSTTATPPKQSGR